MMNFKDFDGAQEFIRGPVRLRNGGEFKNVIHTVIDGFGIDWTVLNFKNKSFVVAAKYPTSREHQREFQRARRVSIPDGTFAQLKAMALEELEREMLRRNTPSAKPVPQDERQRSLFA